MNQGSRVPGNTFEQHTGICCNLIEPFGYLLRRICCSLIEPFGYLLRHIAYCSQVSYLKEGIPMKQFAIISVVLACGVLLVQPVHAELKIPPNAASPRQQQTKPQMQQMKPKAHASSKPGRPGEELGMEKADEEERPSPAQLLHGPAKPQMNVMPARGGDMIINDDTPAGDASPEQIPSLQQQQQQGNGFSMPGSEVGMEKADEEERPSPGSLQQNQGFGGLGGGNPPPGGDPAQQQQLQQQQ